MWWRAAAALVLACAVTGHLEEEEQPLVTACQPLPSAPLAEHLVVHEDQSAAMSCRMDARRSTSAWARVDLPKPHQLAMTVNSFVHVSEPKFHLVNATRPYPHWVLLIPRARAEDSGLYRCSAIYETSDLPDRPTSHLVRLTVLSDERAIISGPRRRHVHSGQTLRLSCVANNTGRPPTWTRDGEPVSIDGERATIDSGPLCSLLTVRDADPADAGSYSCTVDGLRSDSVHVDVIPIVIENVTQVENAATALTNRCALQVTLFISIVTTRFMRIYYV